MSKKINQELLDFIKTEYWDVSEGIMDGGTCIESDLGISGDDADEFIVKFSKRFRVDIQKFDVTMYFCSEGGFSLFSFRKTPEKDLTVAMLDEAIKKGYLK